MKAMRFIKSPAGSVALFIVFLVTSGVIVFRAVLTPAERSRTAEESNESTHPLRETINRPSRAFTSPLGLESPSVTGKMPSERTKALRQSGQPGMSKPQQLPLDLYTATEIAPTKEIGHGFAPYGRLIPCETIVTLESSHLDTPVIGLVTEDVWNAGDLIIPAGTEVHGRAALDHDRERIAASGKWVLVWRDGSAQTGTELVLSGLALDRSKNDSTGEFGMRDGSAGLLGTVVKSDDLPEARLFAATFLSGMANGLEQFKVQPGLAGGAIPVPVASVRTAALRGSSDVLNEYARQIAEAIKRDGFFVRVPAGKQFYLYVTEAIDPSHGTRNHLVNNGPWETHHEQ